jgi:zinc D-Ala-D-Ala carboxypeptidase
VKARYLATIFIVILAFGGYFLLAKDKQTNNNSSEQRASIQEELSEKKGVLRTFSGAEFRELYDSIAYPNSAYISEKSPITGDEKADAYIRKLAEARGYKKRSAPVADNFKTVGKGMLLQDRAERDWNTLVNEARKDGMSLTLTAAYRSADKQKEIFLDRLGRISPSEIISGKVDAKINEILRTTALPGYSRHHTGYTVDIACQNDPNVVFEASVCFGWLSNNNYEKAKEQGWIPSYPAGAGKQGPDPEAWEYVWAGKEILTE